MHITYIGIISRPEDIGRIGIASVAGNKMQYNLLRHLSTYDDVTIDIVSYHPFKSFLSSKKLFIKSSQEYLFDGKVRIWQIGYLNISILKQILYPILVFLKVIQITNKSDIVVAYDMYPSQGIPLSWIKKRVGGRTVCLLADLSIGGVHKESGLRRLLRKIFDWNTLHNIKKCDNFIVLNENAAKVYAPHSNYMIMDGGVEPQEFENNGIGWNGAIKNIVYTGALVEYSGIMNLIKAMSLIQCPNIILDIYGDGPLKTEIEILSKKYANINYHGTISNKEVIQVQRLSWLLANPRPVDHDIAKVTFPSKIFEYMMSGRPVISTRLNGFSKEYENLLFWVEDGSPESISKRIDEISILTNEELLIRADNAKKYLIQNKTWRQNAKRVYDFLNNIK